MQTTVRRIGFWFTHPKPGLMMPLFDPTYAGSSQQRRFVRALRAREEGMVNRFNAALERGEQPLTMKELSSLDITFHFGPSRCQKCSFYCGDYEFQAVLNGVTYVWSETYLHYVEKHGVRPDLAFERAILNNVPHIYSSGIPKVASLL